MASRASVVPTVRCLEKSIAVKSEEFRISHFAGGELRRRFIDSRRNVESNSQSRIEVRLYRDRFHSCFAIMNAAKRAGLRSTRTSLAFPDDDAGRHGVDATMTLGSAAIEKRSNLDFSHSLGTAKVGAFLYHP